MLRGGGPLDTYGSPARGQFRSPKELCSDRLLWRGALRNGICRDVVGSWGVGGDRGTNGRVLCASCCMVAELLEEVAQLAELLLAALERHRPLQRDSVEAAERLRELPDARGLLEPRVLRNDARLLRGGLPRQRLGVGGLRGGGGLRRGDGRLLRGGDGLGHIVHPLLVGLLRRLDGRDGEGATLLRLGFEGNADGGAQALRHAATFEVGEEGGDLLVPLPPLLRQN
mmetsp:Transcript_11525/g.31596  ORF Transcript_11525/g.31596 Transcript_11525/m.31596 type:complete len:227 (+) Transcript_11525:149-829(+)